MLLNPGLVAGVGEGWAEDVAESSVEFESGNKVTVGMSSQTCWTIFLDLMPPGPVTASVLFITKCTWASWTSSGSCEVLARKFPPRPSQVHRMSVPGIICTSRPV